MYFITEGGTEGLSVVFYLFFSHLIVASLLWKRISEGVFDALGVEEGNVMFL